MAPPSQDRRPSAALDRALTVCVLGCRPGSVAFKRRASAAADAYVAASCVRSRALVMACGGRSWNGHVEADELMVLLLRHGVPRTDIVRERCSLDTRDNACFAAHLLARRSLRDVSLVTCAWHLPRAARLFERAGLRVVARVSAGPCEATFVQRAWWFARERVTSMKDERRSMRIAERLG